MLVKGGYINGTKSMRLHPIKNILVKKSDKWSRISVKVNNETVTIGNTYADVFICCKDTSDYNINLMINNKIYYSQKTLFEFEVTIDTDDSSLVEIIDDTIYDG